MLKIARWFSTKVVTKKQVFFDTASVRVVGGMGGRGVSAFQSIKCITYTIFIVIQPGKFTPTGGNGGNGGNVYIRVNPQLDTLLLMKSVYKAEDGHNGKGMLYFNVLTIGKCMHGSRGRDMYIDVPVGTVVYKVTENEKLENNQQVLNSYEEQMRNHFGSKYDEIKKSEKELDELNNTNNSLEDIQKELIYDSSFAKLMEVFCVAKGGKGGEGNHDWYERSKRQNLRNWGSNRDRRLQATYYKVNI